MRGRPNLIKLTRIQCNVNSALTRLGSKTFTHNLNLIMRLCLRLQINLTQLLAIPGSSLTLRPPPWYHPFLITSCCIGPKKTKKAKKNVYEGFFWPQRAPTSCRFGASKIIMVVPLALASTSCRYCWWRWWASPLVPILILTSETVARCDNHCRRQRRPMWTCLRWISTSAATPLCSNNNNRQLLSLIFSSNLGIVFFWNCSPSWH